MNNNKMTLTFGKVSFGCFQLFPLTVMVPLLLFIQEILTVIVKATLGRESELDIPGHWTGVIPEI